MFGTPVDLHIHLHNNVYERANRIEYVTAMRALLLLIFDADTMTIFRLSGDMPSRRSRSTEVPLRYTIVVLYIPASPQRESVGDKPF